MITSSSWRANMIGQGPQENQGKVHFKVSTSRLIFISLSICSALWNNYAILKNRGLNTPSNSMHSKIRHLLRYRPRPILEHLSNNVCEKHAH